jgi:hypothetical protein
VRCDDDADSENENAAAGWSRNHPAPQTRSGLSGAEKVMRDHKQEAERLLDEGETYTPMRETVAKALVHSILALVEVLKEKR